MTKDRTKSDKIYDENNIFARILRGEIQCTKIYEDNNILAFYDIDPVAPIHALVIPKEKYISFDDFTANATQEYVYIFFTTVRKIAHMLNLTNDGYRISTNHGDHAMQTVKHFHVHIMGGGILGCVASYNKS